jgi:hypothetical protein
MVFRDSRKIIFDTQGKTENVRGTVTRERGSARSWRSPGG